MASNVELVRSLYRRWERGDWSSASWADPAIEFTVADGPAPGTWNGLAGMVSGYRQLMNAWDDYRASPERLLALDDERVLVLQRLSGRGKGSGLDLERVHPEAAAVFHVREGRVVKIVLYFARRRALADLGLDAVPEEG